MQNPVRPTQRRRRMLARSSRSERLNPSPPAKNKMGPHWAHFFGWGRGMTHEVRPEGVRIALRRFESIPQRPLDRHPTHIRLDVHNYVIFADLVERVLEVVLDVVECDQY